MATPTTSSRWWLVIAVLALITAWATSDRWFDESSALDGQAHDDHGHGHAHEDAGDVIELSDQGLKNVGYQPAVVTLGEYTRSITVPAVIVERPGQSQIHITAPLTGVVTRIHVIEGEAIEPGSPLFEVRLTHEDLVVAQREFLQNVEQLDVVNSELKRLESIGEGVIAGRRILEQKYEQQKLQAMLRAQHQGLLLHGLSEQQVQAILKSRHLLPRLTVYAPEHDDDSENCPQDHLFHIQRLSVQPGQQVSAGTQLCVIADHCELYVEGRAFEDDAELLREAARKGWSVVARMLTGRRTQSRVEGLRLLYLSDNVHMESRAFHFYLRLSNEISLDRREGPHRFIQWRFKPGQRLELDVPVEKWQDQIVLPVTAVVDEGPESYVFRQNGNEFARLPVHVKYRDHDWVVIDAGSDLAPGETVAGQGAYQMHLAIKNKSGGAIDPHAGHSH